ncbi:MAG TPA: alpha-amylase family protein [Terriglobia bacterium]|nr:alpha-amylase family protein [Terriglobia bacterium]
MRCLLVLSSLLLAWVCPVFAKVVVFWQDGFPAVDVQPLTRQVLNEALKEMQPKFVGMNDFNVETLRDSELLILPYGSAFPADLWNVILGYLQEGGNLLNLGGRPLFVPVYFEHDRFLVGHPQNTYSRLLGIWHSYEVPQHELTRFAWDERCPSFAVSELAIEQVFVTSFWWNQPEVRGLGFFLNTHGERVAAPVVKADFLSLHPGQNAALRGSRCVFLNFKPNASYWNSTAGMNLIREAAAYASLGGSLFRVELQNASLARDESPIAIVYFRNIRRQRRGFPQIGKIRIDLRFGVKLLSSTTLDCSGESVAASVPLPRPSEPGFYQIQATYEESGKKEEMEQTGFWVRDETLLRSGSPLEAADPYLLMNGKPFIPFGTNYFSTDNHYGAFRGGNALVWERDFAEMESNGVNFVRTGIWSNQADVLENHSGGADERYLRGLEAFLQSAARHHIQVNFTFCAFDPQTIRRYPGEDSLQVGPGTNPYTDPVAVLAQKNYVLSVVQRFKDVPFLSWDLINEPSFSNPKRLWKGNTPNADGTELAAWNSWLEQHHQNLQRLASAWLVSPEELKAFGAIALPSLEALELKRYDNPGQLQALDYNLFAQQMFKKWAAEMVSAIRSTGSRQLVNVGQDEGGVADRVLNQFYGDAGVAFTTNHTWWRDDALLWDSVVAKRPGLPNIVGETGVQPVWRMDSSWRWDEINASGLLERKLALGLAAANGGSLQWDWAQGDTYGIKRSDGSNKIWLDLLRGMTAFAQKAAPHLTHFNNPETVIVLPQSLQLSVFNNFALEAQQKCIRALYHAARSSAFVVGEYQIELLGNPKLIILPSPWVFNQKAWETIMDRVRGGAVLLTSGRLDADEYFRPTGRAQELGLAYQPGLLDTRENLVEWSGGRGWLSYGGDKVNHLERACLPDNRTFVEKSIDRGRILFFSLPLELNDNMGPIGAIYQMALKQAKVKPLYSTSIDDPGILICPTQLGSATLYVLTSESSIEQKVTWKDVLSGKEFSVPLNPGRAALILVGRSGDVLAQYGTASGEFQ